MSFWSGQLLTQRVKNEKLVEPFDPDCVKCSAYELHVGYESYISSSQETKGSEGFAPGHSWLGKRGSLGIPPGQFAFLITKEIVTIPVDALGLISIKAGKKFDGLVNVSGFHVDPGWSSRLIFAVFNAGANSITILPDEQLFLLFFASLETDAEPKFQYKEKNKFTRIPSELMQKMSAPVPTLSDLNKAVRELTGTAKSADQRSTHALQIAIAAAALTMAGVVKILYPDPGAGTPKTSPNMMPATQNGDSNVPTAERHGNSGRENSNRPVKDHDSGR